MAKSSTADMKTQALLLARENMRAEPNIRSIYWMPSSEEVRLIEVEPGTVKCLSGSVEPFYFDPAPADGLPAPSGVALIRPDEFGKLTLPRGWGKWDDAVLLEIEK
jgi:hypothetical protein